MGSTGLAGKRAKGLYRDRLTCAGSKILSTKPVDKSVFIAATPQHLLREFYSFVKLLKKWAKLPIYLF